MVRPRDLHFMYPNLQKVCKLTISTVQVSGQEYTTSTTQESRPPRRLLTVSRRWLLSWRPTFCGLTQIMVSRHVSKGRGSEAGSLGHGCWGQASLPGACLCQVAHSFLTALHNDEHVHYQLDVKFQDSSLQTVVFCYNFSCQAVLFQEMAQSVAM